MEVWMSKHSIGLLSMLCNVWCLWCPIGMGSTAVVCWRLNIGWRLGRRPSRSLGKVGGERKLVPDYFSNRLSHPPPNHPSHHYSIFLIISTSSKPDVPFPDPVYFFFKPYFSLPFSILFSIFYNLWCLNLLVLEQFKKYLSRSPLFRSLSLSLETVGLSWDRTQSLQTRKNTYLLWKYNN